MLKTDTATKQIFDQAMIRKFLKAKEFWHIPRIFLAQKRALKQTEWLPQGQTRWDLCGIKDNTMLMELGY